MAAPAQEIGSFGMLDISVASSASLLLFNPLTAQFDAMLSGQFGLGALQADISAQFDAAASLQIDLGLQISDPMAGLQASLDAIAQLSAGLQAALSLGLPTVSAELSASVSANAALTAALGIKLGGISALIELALSLKIPAVKFLADLQASLSAGPIVLVSFGFDGSGTPDPETLGNVGSQLQALFAGGVTGVTPSEEVSGILILTKAPVAAASISALFKVA